MSIPALLDHVVIAGPDLAQLVEWFAAATGVTATPGGVHPSTGTANTLVALTVDGERRPHYVELIAPDPRAAVEATGFGIPGLTGPRLVTYAIHPTDLDAVVAGSRERGYDPGPVEALSRRTPDGTLLQWRLTHSRPDRPDVPFFIDWGDTPQPGFTVDATLELLDLTRVGTDAATDRALTALGLPPGAVVASAAPAVDASTGDAPGGAAVGYALRVRGTDGSTVVIGAT